MFPLVGDIIKIKGAHKRIVGIVNSAYNSFSSYSFTIKKGKRLSPKSQLRLKGAFTKNKNTLIF